MANPATRTQDLHTLNILDMYECQGISTPKIAKRLNMTKNAVVGQIYRVRHDELPCNCTKPNNKEGGMPPRWWDDDIHNRIVATLEHSNTALTLQEIEFLMGTPVPLSVLKSSQRITVTSGYYSLKDVDIQTIGKMAAQGKTDAEISGVFDCSEAEVKR